MLSFKGKHVYLACGHTDMRKSINGLAAIVEGSFKLDLFGGALFVFCNRNKDTGMGQRWVLAVFQAFGEGAFPLACAR